VGVAAQAGSEWRPYDVDTRSIFNLNELLLYTTEVRAWAPLLPWLDAFAQVGWERWHAVSSATAGDHDSLRITLGLSASFTQETSR